LAVEWASFGKTCDQKPTFICGFGCCPSKTGVFESKTAFEAHPIGVPKAFFKGTTVLIACLAQDALKSL
jgi:hypothetical protein